MSNSLGAPAQEAALDGFYVLRNNVPETQLDTASVVRSCKSLSAEVFGLRDVGTLAPGRSADLVVFDPATVAPGRESYVRDVPGGVRRYLRDAVGVDAVFVAGEPIVERGEYRDARRGRVI